MRCSGDQYNREGKPINTTRIGIGARRVIPVVPLHEQVGNALDTSGFHLGGREPNFRIVPPTVCRSLPHRHAQLVARERNRPCKGRTNRLPHRVLLPFDIGRKVAQQ